MQKTTKTFIGGLLIGIFVTTLISALVIINMLAISFINSNLN